MTTYHVTAKRWAHGWELHIDGVGVTQSRTLAGAGWMISDYLALDLGGEPESYDVAVTPELDEDLAAEAETARQAVREAEKAQRDAAAARSELLHAASKRTAYPAPTSPLCSRCPHSAFLNW